MSKRRFNMEQVKELLKNKNVARCSEKSISYSKEFKLWAIKQCSENGMPARKIFADSGFDPIIVDSNTPKDCLTNWRRIIRVKGLKGLQVNGQGKKPGFGRQKTKGMTDAEKIKRLEATVAYLKAENDFLVKLRAQRKS